MARDELINPLEGSLNYQMRRASLETTSKLAEDMSTLGLKLAEAAILRLISANPGCSQGEIGRCLGVQRTNMVPIITALIRRQLVHRTRVDGRTQALRLTAAGEELHAQALEISDAHEREFFGDVPAELKSQFMAVCLAARGRLAAKS